MMWSAAATTRRNREYLVSRGWGMLISAPYLSAHSSAVGPWPMALDNGAWSRRGTGMGADPDVLRVALDRMRGRIRWFVLPDIVAGGRESWRLTTKWASRMTDPEHGRPYAAVQDGIPASALDDLPEGVGVFVGGTTEWKERTILRWVAAARERGVPCHVGRVNTLGRLRRCAAAGVDSVDGSGAAIFQIHAEKMTRWARELAPQPSLWSAR